MKSAQIFNLFTPLIFQKEEKIVLLKLKKKKNFHNALNL